MSAAAFAEAVLGRHEAAAVFEVASPADVAPRVAAAWLRSWTEFEGYLPGTSVPAVILVEEDGWYGVLPGHEFAAAPLHYAAAAVAAALSVGGVADAGSVAAVGPVVDAVLSATTPTFRAVEPAVERPQRQSVVAPAPRSRRAAVVKVTHEEAARACAVCGHPQATAGELTGCTCFAALVQASSVRRLHGCWLVIPGPDWGLDAVASFAEAVRG